MQSSRRCGRVCVGVSENAGFRRGAVDWVAEDRTVGGTGRAPGGKGFAEGEG